MEYIFYCSIPDILILPRLFFGAAMLPAKLYKGVEKSMGHDEQGYYQLRRSTCKLSKWHGCDKGIFMLCSFLSFESLNVFVLLLCEDS